MAEQIYKKVDLKTSEEDAGSRLDQCIARLLPDYSRVFLKKLILEGLVKVNGKECKVPRTAIKAEMEIALEIPEEKKRELIAEKIDLEVLFEDNDIIVINKPAGIVVHPAAGNWSGTIVNALLGRDDAFAENLDDPDEMRPGIVHRLDKDTSGCLVIAKTQQAQMKLSKSFAARDVKKVYAAISYGWPQVESERISTRISRHHVNRKKMAVVNELHGKLAVTSYELIKMGKISDVPVSLLKVKIFTGRTHQIRVHLSYKKLPILGDETYGGKTKLKIPRQMLHAWKIAFPHPVTGEEMTFTSPFPADFENVIKKIQEE